MARTLLLELSPRNVAVAAMAACGTIVVALSMAYVASFLLDALRDPTSWHSWSFEKKYVPQVWQMLVEAQEFFEDAEARVERWAAEIGYPALPA